MGYFGDKSAKVSPTKYHSQDPASNNKFGRQQENSYIVQHASDEIILQDSKTLSVKDETHDNIYF